MTVVVHTSDDNEEVVCPSMSRQLRKSSLKKRLETQIKISQPKAKERIGKKYRLSKYRRKCENAKERERMKKFNDAFNTLRKLLPDANASSEDKDTKVKKT